MRLHGLLRSKLHPAEALVPQVESPTQVTQDFAAQLRTICDPVLHTYLFKVADTAEKRHYLHVLCTAVEAAITRRLDSLLDMLHEFKIFDFDLSVFHPHCPRVLLATLKMSLAVVCHSISRTFDRIQNEAESSIMKGASGMHLSRLVT